jgi:hypothetical protein
MNYRANYAQLQFGEHLGPDQSALGVPWASYVGDRSSELTFEIAAEPHDPYLEVQAYEIGSFDHEILVNDEPVSGFDLPPAEGWQYWMDSITGATLVVGENTIQVVRDVSTDDSFVIGNVVVHWKESLE